MRTFNRWSHNWCSKTHPLIMFEEGEFAVSEDRRFQRVRKMVTPEQLAKSNSEDAHQIALFCWTALPHVRAQHPLLEWLFAIPNGGSRHGAEAAKLKSAGVRAGVFDILFAVPRNFKHGLFIEMKAPKRQREAQGGLSDDQVRFKAWAESQGYECAVAYTWVEARDILLRYLADASF